MASRPVRLAIHCAAVAAGLACNDQGPPSRPAPYEWRLFLPVGPGPAVDTLSFHWPRSSLPVKIWVEDQYAVPDRVREGIALWKGELLQGEWNATVVTDSSTADVIVRATQASAIVSGAARLRTSFVSCEGLTVLDTVATRFELRVPVRMYVYPISPDAGDVVACLHTVATHELGHTLGIFQHSPDPEDIMFTTPSVAQPSARDGSTAYQAYHTPATMVPVRP